MTVLSFLPRASGKEYKLHSDKTTEDKKYGRKERTVILIREIEADQYNFKYKQVICYYLKHYKGGTNPKGEPLNDAKTWRHLTISFTKNDHEVLGLWRFTDDPYNLERLNNSTKPTSQQE